MSAAAVNLAINCLNERLTNADAIAQALTLAGGDNPPPWVHLYATQLEGITEASRALESLLLGGGHD